MIWTYVGIGLTIFFGGVGVGIPIGIWIGNMMSAQKHLRRDLDELRDQVREMATVQKIRNRSTACEAREEKNGYFVGLAEPAAIRSRLMKPRDV